MLASQLALPRKGYLDAVSHIIAYLKQKYNSCLVLDPTYPVIDERTFKKCDWKDLTIPEDAP